MKNAQLPTTCLELQVILAPNSYHLTNLDSWVPYFQEYFHLNLHGHLRFNMFKSH